MRTDLRLGLAITVIAPLLGACGTTNDTATPPVETAAPATTFEADATLRQFDWIVGDWIGRRNDGTVMEESWRPAIGPSMVGTFRVVRGEQVGFYEIMTIEVEEGEPVFRVKHFNTGLAGWEDKDAANPWPLTASSPNSATFELANDDGFERLVFTRTSDDLTINLVIRQGDNERTVPFQFSREP